MSPTSVVRERLLSSLRSPRCLRFPSPSRSRQNPVARRFQRRRQLQSPLPPQGRTQKPQSPLPRKPRLPKFLQNRPKMLRKRKTCWLSQKRGRAKRAFSAPVNIFGGGSYRNLIDNCSMMKRESLQDGQYVWSQRSTTVYPTIHWLSINPLFLRLMSETFFVWAFLSI